MKLLVLHLSDMHFSETNNYENANVQAIVSALQPNIKDIKHVLILVSGDLSFSGKKYECIKVNYFFQSLIKNIKKRYKIEDCSIGFVPGNHDIDYRKGDRRSSGLAEIEKQQLYNSCIDEELEKQEHFYRLAEIYNGIKKNKLLHCCTFVYGEKKIQINLINTAVFSSLENDQGYHYLPIEDIEKLNEQGDNDYIITVMHHPHHWYSECCKKQLEQALYSRSDIVFVGHEHYESSQKVEDGGATVNIFAGGRLCNKGDWTDSEFHIGLLDLNTREYTSKKYRWNNKAGIYEKNSDDTKIILSQDRYNKLGLAISTSFSKKLYEDKYSLSNSVLDYFVFPLLVEEQTAENSSKLPEEISEMGTFLKKIHGKKKIVISGYSGSGKSVLAKALCNELSMTKCVLYVEGKKYSGSNERTVKNAFEDMYTSDPSKYQEFQQMRPSDLVIIVDDIDAINDRKQDDFIEYLSSLSETLILTCQSDIEIDIKSRLKKRVATDESMFLHVARFYTDKRKALVEKVVSRIIIRDNETQDKTVDVLCEALTRLKSSYSWNPDFLVQFVKCYCMNVGEAARNDGSVFSKVFENNLISLILPFARKDLLIDKIFVVLDKIAYYTFVHKKYPILIADIDAVIQKYNEQYGSTINSYDFITILIDAKILKKYNEGYIFYERNYLAYFTAREIKRQCADGDQEQFRHILEYSYMQINMDILMFITYIVDSPAFIRSIMEKAYEVIADWKEYDFNDTDINFLAYGPEQIVSPVTDEDAQREEKEEIDREKEEEKELMVRSDITIFEGEAEELNYYQRLMRALSLMIVVARILPSFEQIMDVQEKERCVKLIYSMPLMIFRALAERMDEESGALIKEIKDYHDYVYRKEKPNVEAITDDKALYILRWEALSMLLEFMNSSFANATRQNTYVFLDRFPYKNTIAYNIEHLMSLERRDDLTNFEKDAIDIFSKSKLPIIRSTVQRITKHFLVRSKKVKTPDRDRLNAKIFGYSMNRGKLLAETNRNKGRN